MKAQDLNTAISAVCPIDGVSIGRWNDRATWRIDFKSEATPDQRAAAQTVINTFDTLVSVKSEFCVQIDTDAEAVRLKHLSPGSGMALTYQEKFAQAQAVSAMGRDAANALSQAEREAQFPTLSASVGIEAPTLADAADLVLARYAQFARLSLHIERTRLSGKASIQAAPSEADVEAAYRAISWTLP